MENHKIIANYLKDKKIITFGGIKDEAFIFKLPNSRVGKVSILFTEHKSIPQQNSFDNKRLTYESRSTQIFIFSSNMKVASDKAEAIYRELHKVTKLGNNLFNIKLQSPIYIGEKDNVKDEIFLVDLDYDFVKK